MPKFMRTIDSALLPHARPCWCDECKRAYAKIYDSQRSWPTYLNVCIICGERFSSRKQTSSFCSSKCQGRSRTRIGYCIEPECGKVFKTQGKRRRCDEHVIRMWRPGPPASEFCRGCLRQFTPQPNRRTQVCCSSKCWRDLKTQMRWFSRWNLCDLPLCCICDEPTLKGRGSFTCDKCKNRAKTEQDRVTGRTNLKNAKRRSAAHDGDAGITVVALRARDGDFCRACGFKIDFDAGQCDDLAPEIDHVVPLAREGTHTWDNVQLLHGHCNRSKGARLIPDRPTLFDEEIA